MFSEIAPPKTVENSSSRMTGLPVQAHAHAVFRLKAEFRHGVSDCRRSDGCRGEARIVEHRLHQDKAAQRQRMRRLPGKQSCPIQRRNAPGNSGLGGVADRPQGVAKLSLLRDRLSADDAIGQQPQGLGDTTQAGIGGKRAQHRLRRNDLLRRLAHLVRLGEEQGAATGGPPPHPAVPRLCTP
ncbi:hypothetical protein [Dankookia sp. P2]|uniref:hypothetical protein n=1 Tax=Dankookia sp. P2 TaxID=3423955 RepID=UPI003D67EA87